jgi:predicted transcriptional regulator
VVEGFSLKVKTIHLNEEGLNRFFGSLEASIMEVLWDKEKLTIKQVHEILQSEDGVSLSAVMTVMLRLADKGHLIKDSSGGGRSKLTFFSPVQKKEQFILEQTKVVTDGLVEDFGSLMVSHLIDNMDKADPDLLLRLEQKLNELKNKS